MLSVLALAEVDPRVCGGATDATDLNGQKEGRSPRMRGSPHNIVKVFFLPGSIPAYAGEPDKNPIREKPNQVDPRVCGGALSRLHLRSQYQGRSPRMRGSH